MLLRRRREPEREKRNDIEAHLHLEQSRYMFNFKLTQSGGVEDTGIVRVDAEEVEFGVVRGGIEGRR